jgi:hypothetical protein
VNDMINPIFNGGSEPGAVCADIGGGTKATPSEQQATTATKR